MNETERDTEYRIKEVHAALDRRIEALEERGRRRRGLGGIGLATAVGALAVALFGLTQIQNAYFVGEVAPVLEARALLLRDGDGLERGALRVSQDGTVSLSLRDGTAKSRLRMSVLADGSPGVSLLDANGDTRAILGFLPDGTTTLVFADAGSVARTVLALTPDGASRIVFSDHLGETRTAVGVDGSGRPEVNTMTAAEGGS
jgi:hypothetical protein